MIYTVKLKDTFDLKEEDVLKHHSWLKPLLEEIKGKGLEYRILNVDAEVLVELDLDKLVLNLKYYAPRIDEFGREGTYELSAELGNKPPAIIKVLSIKSFEIDISTKHCPHAIRIDPFKRKINYISDVLWNFGEEKPKNLAEAREVYEVAKWLVEEKGFELKDEYVIKDYKKLLELFEKPYKFTMKLELTVKDINAVPGWGELKKELFNFFYERGLLVELKREKKGLQNLFRKPIP